MRLQPWRGREGGSSVGGLQHEVNRLFDEFWRGWNGGQTNDLTAGNWTPSLDVAETQDAIVVTLDLPGIDPKEIDITVTNNILTVKGEKKSEVETGGQDKNYHRVERFFGSFSRSVVLPSNVDVDKIEADAKHGVLTITLPKHEQAKPRQIKISSK